MEIAAVLDPRGAQAVELNVLRSPDAEEVTRIIVQKRRGYRGKCTITLDNTRSSILPDVRSRPPETAQFELRGNDPVEFRIFIDRSVVEVFVNGRQYVALRVYPGREDSVGVSLRAVGQDATLRSLDAWQMKNIYETRHQ